MDEVALGQAFLLFGFALSVSFHHCTIIVRQLSLHLRALLKKILLMAQQKFFILMIVQRDATQSSPS